MTFSTFGALKIGMSMKRANAASNKASGRQQARYGKRCLRMSDMERLRVGVRGP
jgi:hypothetical protein